MVTMRPITVAFVICVLATESITERKHSVQDSSRFAEQFMVHVQVQEPAGILIWTRYNPLIEMFGIELYIGKHNLSHKEPIWDRQLKANVTSTVDEKFFIQDRDMIVEVDDAMRYRFFVVHQQNISYSQYRNIAHAGERIFSPKNTICLSECLAQAQPGYHQKVADMKEILERKILQCIGSQSSEYLFFPLDGAITLVADPMHFVIYRLFQIDGLRPVIDNVLIANVVENGVVVKMRTVIDKLKVLELGREKLTVIDYDDYLNVEGSGEGQW